MGKRITTSEWRTLASMLAKALDREHEDYNEEIGWACAASCSTCRTLLAYEEATGQKKDD